VPYSDNELDVVERELSRAHRRVAVVMNEWATTPPGRRSRELRAEAIRDLEIDEQAFHRMYHEVLLALAAAREAARHGWTPEQVAEGKAAAMAWVEENVPHG
jgi:hypothetical protein